LLGFEVDNTRPDLGYTGVWLTIGSQQIHLLELPNPDPSHDRPEHGGRDRHIALAITNLTNLKKALDKQRIPFTESKSGRAAIFFRDPDGNALEMIESELI
jgi:glyoxylase I family protein